MMRNRLLQTFAIALIISLRAYGAVNGARVSTEKETDGEPGVNLNVPAEPLLSGASRHLSLIDKTYLDAYALLRTSNSCSRFFGGPRAATSVLNFLYPRLRQTALNDAGIGIIMTGAVTFGSDARAGFSYRLFEKAMVNLKGPFFQSFDARTHGFFQKVGYFAANTRETRVAMMLHELGHLLSGPGGHWLLADDADNLMQVRANTATIMEQCGEQIKSLALESAR